MAKRQVAAAAATAPPARVRRGEQRDPSAAAKEMMQESMAEIQGLAKASEVAADTDADVDVSQNSTRKRKDTETTPRAEASSLALARSLHLLLSQASQRSITSRRLFLASKKARQSPIRPLKQHSKLFPEVPVFFIALVRRMALTSMVCGRHVHRLQGCVG